MTSYDSSTALIVVDVQNDFATPAGSLYVQEGETIVPVINDEIERARRAGAAVVYTQDWHPPSTPHFERDGGIWPVHCVGGTWGAEFHPDLVFEGEVVRKGSQGDDGYSGFTERDPASGQEKATPLEEVLRDKGIRRIVVVGLATDYCVRATVLDALARGFDVTVVGNAIRPVEREPGDADAAVREMTVNGAKLE
ncbi:MAG: isochorismatase family protein [Actinomycetota bacterium]